MFSGSKLKKIRKSKGMTQAMVAELIDVSDRAISEWERDKSKPSTTNLFELARVLCVAIEELCADYSRGSNVICSHSDNPLDNNKLGGIIAMFGVIVTGVCGLLYFGASRDALLWPMFAAVGIMSVGVLVSLSGVDRVKGAKKMLGGISMGVIGLVMPIITCVIV